MNIFNYSLCYFCIMRSFKILLVNDDGYKAMGINILDKVLSEAGHEVWVLAPESQRSACSHAISLSKRIAVIKNSERHYYCEGFPADCVLFADKGVIPQMGKPEIVISGINHGYNVSTDLVYSATAGGAAEGALRGYPSFAVSCSETGLNENVFYDAARFMLKHLEEFYSVCEENCFININVPENSGLKWQVADVGNMEYYDNLVKHEQDDTYYIKGTASPRMVDDVVNGTDFHIVHSENKIAVSMIRVLPAVHEAGQRALKGL